MPIPGIVQPDILRVSDRLQLRKFDGVFAFALPWYLDEDTVYLVDGVREPYTMEKLELMYRYLDRHGELYFIEAAEEEGFRPIGDVTFWQEDMPIVLGDKAYRGQQIGSQVIAALKERGRTLGYTRLYVQEIYDFNMASQRCFEKAGFRPIEKTEKGKRYMTELE